VTLWVRVQAHPSRRDLLPDLLERLHPLPVEVRQHSSIPPNPWAGYVECLKNLPECSHILIIQDDAIPCQNFPEALVQVARSHPHTPVCLFLGGAPSSTAAQARRAWNKGLRYTPLLNSSFVPLVAVLWPREKAQAFLEWSRTARITRADDGNAAKWMKRARQPFICTVPSLVEHNDFVESVKGGRVHTPGKEAWRQAVLLAQDGLQYEW
jgi:hypothetical protein